MNGERGVRRLRPTAPPPTSIRIVLAPFSTRLPPDVVDRLRIAAPQLHIHQGEIAAIAIERYLHDHGY